jgi:5-formyltetrahydrofolate cyclo-ligase
MTAAADRPEIVDAKKALRAAAAERRRAAVAALPPAAAGRLARDALLAAIAVPAGAPVSGFWPLDGEFDPRPLIEHFHDAGHVVALPVVIGRGQPLLFRRWQPGMALVPGSFRVLTPPPEAPEVTPAVVLAPLLAFDAAGYRLGYGGGFYDRTLARLRAAGHVLAIGVGYAAQEVAAVPREPTDQPLDWIVTEQGARRIAGTSASGNRY